MLNPKKLRADIAAIAAKLKTRGFVLDVTQFAALEQQRKQLQTDLQDLQSQRNAHAKSVGMAKGKGLDITDLLAQNELLGEALKNKESEFESVQTALNTFLAAIPNVPSDTVPMGHSEADNQVVRTWGEPSQFSFPAKDHVELGAMQHFMDFATAVKLTKSRFVVLHGPLANLHRALTQFMLDLHSTQHGYAEICVPFIVNADSLFGTGQLPKFAEDQFKLAGDEDLYLIPTSEVPVTNLVRDAIVEQALPLKYVCHSPCFRSEAGSYGKDTRGMIRQHQFEKVELVQIVEAEKSYQALEDLTQCAEKVLQLLELPYRLMSLCTADIGFSAAKTYDLEVWLPGQACYREISSCSNMEDFQARRMSARWRNPATGKPELVHTLNGSALAIGRTLVAVMENYQDEDGHIQIPKVLQPYMNGVKII